MPKINEMTIDCPNLSAARDLLDDMHGKEPTRDGYLGHPGFTARQEHSQIVVTSIANNGVRDQLLQKIDRHSHNWATAKL